MCEKTIPWKLYYSYKLENSESYETDCDIIYTEQCSFREVRKEAFEFCKKNNCEPFVMIFPCSGYIYDLEP